MPAPVVAELWSDPHCPFSYVLAHRLRRLAPRLARRVELRWRALPVELEEGSPTPHGLLQDEIAHLAPTEPGLPYAPWPPGQREHPTTFLPALEAVAAAQALDEGKTWELDWRIRRAFFAEHARIDDTAELARLATAAGIDPAALAAELASGRPAARVRADADEGWRKHGFEGVPTLVLPDGEAVVNPAGAALVLDPQGRKVARAVPGPEDPLTVLAGMLGLGG